MLTKNIAADHINKTPRKRCLELPVLRRFSFVAFLILRFFVPAVLPATDFTEDISGVLCLRKSIYDLEKRCRKVNGTISLLRIRQPNPVWMHQAYIFLKLKEDCFFLVLWLRNMDKQLYSRRNAY